MVMGYWSVVILFWQLSIDHIVNVLHKGRCPLLLLRTFSAHAKVVARDAKEMRNTQDARTGFVPCKSGAPGEVRVISCGKDASFFNRWKIISIYLVSSLKTEEVCACCYSCRMIDWTFYSQTKVNSKTSKVIASRCYGWSLGIKQSLNSQGSVNQKENSS